MSIYFEAALIKLNSLNIIKIPTIISKKLPSRGMVMIEGTFDGIPFNAPLEPDGTGSHFLEVSDALIKESGVKVGKSVSLNMESMDEWIEPEVPSDIMQAIKNENLIEEWNSITVQAKWDWIRWIRATKNIDTRNKRIHVACDKLKKGDKRPCCFDRSSCTINEVSKSGILLDE